MKTKMNNDYETEMSSTAAVISVGEENSEFSTLRANLAEVRELKGVVGYILRSGTSAIVDLSDSNRIIEYAALSSEMNDSCFEMAKRFNLGDCKSILVEGENVQVLCMNMGENRISVFLEKSINPTSITERFMP
jgi:predicted regulator of Ras-like GTPase activity (Roadblock/LC7/MglB family)